MKRNVLFILICFLLQACSPAEPYYDDTIGLEGVATEPGALAGVFGQKVFAATLVQVPLFPDEMGGGFQWLRVERTYDEASDSYMQESMICDGRNVEVHGTSADVPRSTYRAVPPSENETFIANHETGEQSAEGLLQLWGVRDLAQPATEPFPETAEQADANGFSEKIYDMDEDSEPGYSTFVEGAANGTAYGVLRRQTTYKGVVLGPDRIVGIAETAYDSLFLGADDDIVEQMMSGESPAFPDPKESWFEELRMDDTADCDAVVELEESETFSRLRPF